MRQKTYHLPSANAGGDGGGSSSSETMLHAQLPWGSWSTVRSLIFAGAHVCHGLWLGQDDDPESATYST